MVVGIMVVTLLQVAAVTTVGAFTVDLNIRQCDESGCTPAKKRVALDATSNHTGPSGESLIAVGGGADADALTLTYGGASVGGPRVYLIEEEGTNKNTLFMLKNREFAFDVNLSSMPCGFNAALYFVGMNSNDGGAETGTNYCDAQAVDGIFCSEMDLFEANTRAQQYTTHACVDACGSFDGSADECKASAGASKAVCDQSGCGLNPFRYGPGTTYNAEYNNANWYGPGASYKLDSTKPFTVVTSFHVDGSNMLANITRFYMQAGNRIDLPPLYVLPPTDGQHMGADQQPSITADFCTFIYDRWHSDGLPLSQMGKNMESGMVLAMSAWYAQEVYTNGKPQGSQTGMSWLDGVNNWGKYIKAGPCDTTTTDTEGPYRATFSNIRFGTIGSTVPNAPPAPPPPAPPGPPPGPTGKCCYNGCSSGNCATSGFCAASQKNCVGNCHGSWCTAKNP